MLYIGDFTKSEILAGKQTSARTVRRIAGFTNRIIDVLRIARELQGPAALSNDSTSPDWSDPALDQSDLSAGLDWTEPYPRPNQYCKIRVMDQFRPVQSDLAAEPDRTEPYLGPGSSRLVES
jgi:hypothetical protein